MTDIDEFELEAHGLARLTGSQLAAGAASPVAATASGSVVLPDGTEMMRSASGNIGIGVTPSPWNSAVTAMEFGLSGSISADDATNYVEYGNNFYRDSGGIEIYKSNGAACKTELQTDGSFKWKVAPAGTAGNPISFTQAMTLDTSGNLLVGTTGTGSSNISGATMLVEVFGSYADTGHNSTATGGLPYARYRYNGGLIGSITQSGTTAVLYNTSSDARLKESIAAADNGSALIDQLQVRQFDWKADGSHQRYGFIAQELDTVYPEAVSKSADPEEMMGVDYSKLVPLLVQEVQSLRARVAALESAQAV